MGTERGKWWGRNEMGRSQWLPYLILNIGSPRWMLFELYCFQRPQT